MEDTHLEQHPHLVGVKKKKHHQQCWNTPHHQGNNSLVSCTAEHVVGLVPWETIICK